MLSLLAAHGQVNDLCEPTLDPVLSPAEIDAALTRTAYGSTWLPSTAYAEGQFVVPTVPMGRIYRCVLPGTSDLTAPQWLIAPPYMGPVNPLAGSWWGIGIIPIISNVTGTPWFFGLADGTCAWRDFSGFTGEIYNVRAAASEAWRMKARKCATRVDSSIARGVSARESQMYTMCMAQANALMPVRFA